MTSIVALVPARGGSKGLPGKNLRLLGGIPLLAHSIVAGRDARHIDRVYVSTDDEKIADVARSYGAEVIERPAELATDVAQNDGVAVHALAVMSQAGFSPDILVLLQPTSPLRTAWHVDECLEAQLGRQARSAMSVSRADHHPGKYVLVEDGIITPFTNDHDMEARRQTLPDVFRQNGAIYAVDTDDLIAKSRFYVPPCIGYVMPRRLSVDIDDQLDLQLAELIMANAGPEG
jgi:CMP-N,N'-diacetyllegionaminic acid synthase